MSYPSGPLTEKHDRDLHPPYTRNGHVTHVSKDGKHLSTGIEADDVDGDGKPVPKWKLWYAKGMLVWAAVSQVFLLLQAIKIFGEQNASGVSLLAYIIYVFGSIVWFVYGAFVLSRRNLVIVTSSVIATILGIIVLTGVIIYGDKPKDCSSEIAAALEASKS